MKRTPLVVLVLLSACSIASAEDVLLTGHVQKVILQPSGTDDCPPPCPVAEEFLPNGMHRICASNMGGCQTMEVAVDRVFRGQASERTLRFKSRIGEWGPSFPVTDKKVVVVEEGGRVFWSIATMRENKVFVEALRLHGLSGMPVSPAAKGELVALDEVLARMGPVR